MGLKLTTEKKQSEPGQLLPITEVKNIYYGKNTTESFSEQSGTKLKTKRSYSRQLTRGITSKQRRTSLKVRSSATVSKKKQFGQLGESSEIHYRHSYDLKQLSNNFVTEHKLRVSEQKRRDAEPLQKNITRKQRENGSKRQQRLTTDQRTNCLELQDMSSELTMDNDSKKFSNNLAKEEKRSDSELLNSNLKTEQQTSEFQLGYNLETQQNKSNSQELHSSLSPEKKSSASEKRNNNLKSAQEVSHGKLSLTTETKSNYSIEPSGNVATESKQSNLPNSLATQKNKNDSGNLSNILTTEQKDGVFQQMGGILTREQTKHVSEEHSQNLTTELQKNNLEPQSINLATEQKKSEFEQLSDNLTTQQNKKGSGQLHSNLSAEKKSIGSDQRSNGVTSVQGVNYAKTNLATETKSNYSRQPSSNLATEPKKGNLSLQLPSSLATQQNKDSGNLSNILAAELKDSESEQTRENLILELKKNVSEGQSNNLTTLLKKNESDPQSINLGTEQKKRNVVLQQPSSFANDENKNDSGHLHGNFSPEKNISASKPRRITLTSEQGVKSGNLNLATETKTNYSGQLRSNMATEPKKSNLSLQLSNSLTTQQKEGESEQMGCSLTVEPNRNVSQQQSNNLTAEQKNNDSEPSRRNSTTEQKKSDLVGEDWDSQQQVTEHEKCYDSQDASLTFTDADDGLDFLCEDYKSLRALMSCGHAVTPMSLTNWCHYLLDKGESQFVCGQPDCNAKWTYDEVCKMALLTPEEIEYFETKMFNSIAKDYLDVKACPGCKSSVVRSELSDLRVLCTVCTADRRKIFEFCWQCLNEWKDPCQYSDGCGNDGCINKPLEILKTCPNITFKDVRGVTGCPSTRACPTCGLLVVHNGTKCKNLKCPRCKVEFCFVCLRLTVVCSSFFNVCSTGVAPRQTSMPVWKKN